MTAAARLGHSLLLAAVLGGLAAGCVGSRDSAPPNGARAFVESHYAKHFAAGQGFSLATLRARRSRFTQRLYQLMLADMDAPSGAIGYIDHDPFTDAQDDAERFTVGSARQSHDTVLVDVDIAFDSTVAEGQVDTDVTVAVVPARNGWEIANFLSASGDLASKLSTAAPSDSTASQLTRRDSERGGVAPADSESDARRVERYRLDLDGDGVPDDLVLRATRHPDGPGVFRQLDVVLSSSGAHSVNGLWDPPDAESVGGSDNLVASKTMIVGRSRGAGTLIFLFGEDVSCCLQGLQVYRISPAGIDKYFERREFALIEPLRQSRQDVMVLEAIEGMSEVVGSSAPDALSAETYNPIVVRRLEEHARVDTASSARATIAKLGGFAGVGEHDEIRAITGRDGSHYLWDEAQHRRLPPPDVGR